MISERAKDSFGRIFAGAARLRLTTSEADACEIALRPEGASLPQRNVAVLTISSMQFRLLLLLHFDDDAGMRDYYVGETGRSLADAFMEVANLCCGAMNQQLVEHFPDLGMSTPYALSSRCVPYLTILKPAYVASYDVSINGTVQIGATLCVCTVAPLDFVANEAVAADSGGELELF
jgi:hypothetical protein